MGPTILMQSGDSATAVEKGLPWRTSLEGDAAPQVRIERGYGPECEHQDAPIPGATSPQKLSPSYPGFICQDI